MTALKTFVLAATVASLPGLAAAMCGHDAMQQAQSCAEGSTWDAATQTCLPVANS